MIKYQIRVFYQTDATKEVSGYMERIFDDWGNHGKHLEVCQTLEFRVEEPLTEEQKERLLATKPDWAEKLELVEIKES